MPDPFFSGKAAYQKRRKFSSSQLALYGWSSLFGKKVTLVLVYKCGQEKLNDLYYEMKEQRRCS
ncbi:hypothetical protein, partial [Enterocloster clostridioformis]